MNRSWLHAFRSIVICLAVLAASVNCHAEESLQEDDLQDLQERFAALVEAELAEGIAPGFSVAWIVDGEVVHAAGYGFADWEAKVPASADTVYRAGSISKLFNAIAVMQQVEQGKLDLDAAVQPHYQGFPSSILLQTRLP
jgi:CubicO group peptidase (beta-lactamase class C family)